MSVTSWYQVLSTAESAGAVLANFTTSVSCLPAHAKRTVAPDDWWVGKRLRLNVAGNISNVVTAAPTFTFDLRFGSTTGIWNSGAIVCSTTAHTTVPFMMSIDLTCRAVGATANLMGQGWIGSRAIVDASGADVTTTGHPFLFVPETTPAVGANFDANASQQVDLWVACSAANAATGITVQQYELLASQL